MPFLWTADWGMQALGEADAKSLFGFANAVNGTGSVIAGELYFTDSSAFAAFVWDPYHGIRLLDDLLADELPSGWQLESARGLSADGNRIVGYGRNPEGHTEGFLATLDLSTPPALNPGDANLDGRVDLLDFDVLKAHFGKGLFWYQGDFDGSHDVGLVDFGILKEHFGQASSVPEPATCVLELGALVALAFLSLRKKPRA
jgi:hypothetical protein